MISVLIPSRGRAESLAFSVKSLCRLAENPSFEILVAADPDDEVTIAAARKLGCKLHVAPARLGYQGLHHYYNYLASQATGEWMWLWNDDCRVLTRGWDEIIHEQPDAILHPQIDIMPQHNSFPVIPAKWAQLLGYISPTPGVDLWWHALGKMTEMPVIPVKVRHSRAEGDQVAAERDARDLHGELDVFNSIEAQVARWNDAQKIQEYLGKPPLIKGEIDAVVFLLTGGNDIQMWQPEEACA